VGWVLMSERELDRVEVLSQVSQGRMTAVTAVTAANVLGLSRRQVHRLLKRFESEGAASIRHKARGRPSTRRIDPGLREYGVSLVREQFADFGPTLAAEMLEDITG
jgi:predicted ArsR family transcriptional regulator